MQSNSSSPAVGAQPSVRQAYRNVLRFIHGRRLRHGDRLPSQVELRHQMSLGNEPLAQAMRLLVRDGVLSRRRKTGTVVRDVHRAKQTVWTVGITQHDPHGTGYPGILEYYLRRLLVQQGCEDRTFFRPAPPRDRPHRLEDFHGLREAVDAGQLDVIVTPEYLLAGPDVLVFHLGEVPASSFGICPDLRTFLRAAMDELVCRGCRRITWYGGAQAGFLEQEMLQRRRRMMGRLRPDGVSASVRSLPEWTCRGGHELAGRLLKRPAGKRPEGVILMDDYATLGFTDRLRGQGEYRPSIVAVANRQIPLLFPLPVIRFEIDIEQVAQQAVRLLMRRLLNPEHPLSVETYPIHPVATVSV